MEAISGTSHAEVGVPEWTTAPRTSGTDPALAAAYALTFDVLSENVLTRAGQVDQPVPGSQGFSRLL